MAEDPDLTSADGSGAIASRPSGRAAGDPPTAEIPVTGRRAAAEPDASTASRPIDGPSPAAGGHTPTPPGRPTRPAAAATPPSAAAATPLAAATPPSVAAATPLAAAVPPSVAAATPPSAARPATPPVTPPVARPVTPPPVARPVTPPPLTPPLTPAAAPRPKADWAAEVADRIDEVVLKVRANTSDRLVGVARMVVYGLLAAVMGTMAAVLAVIFAIRLLNVAIPGDVWIPYLLLGAIFLGAGLFLWSKRTAQSKA